METESGDVHFVREAEEDDSDDELDGLLLPEIRARDERFEAFGTTRGDESLKVVRVNTAGYITYSAVM